MASQSKRKAKKKAKFLAEHPHCCFCGGETPSVEIDHLPSRACFDGKNYPDGFEFPACRDCNASTRADEQIVALLSRMLSNPNAAASPDEIRKYMSGVANNNINVFAELSQVRRNVGENLHLLEFGNATDDAFQRVLTRWAKAFHYRETSVIIPADARIYVTYFTNANLGEIPPGSVAGHAHELRRNGKNIGDQFAYITTNDPNRPDLGYYTAAFRRSFLAIMLVDFHGEIGDEPTV